MTKVHTTIHLGQSSLGTLWLGALRAIELGGKRQHETRTATKLDIGSVAWGGLRRSRSRRGGETHVGRTSAIGGPEKV